MKRSFALKLNCIFFTLLLPCTIARCQENRDYSTLITEARLLFEKKIFLEAGLRYTEAFAAMGDKGEINDRYNAACAFSLAQRPDDAFKQLLRIATVGKYSNLDHISGDPDLESLHADSRWKEVIHLIGENKVKEELTLDKALAALLDSVFNEDQQYRLQLRDAETKYGRDSDEMKKLWNTIRETDSSNLLFITKLLDERGWLGPDIVGGKGNQAIFLVVQHAGLQTQEKYLPMMREAVTKGNARASSLALLEDRVALRQGKRQVYGSQIGINPATGEHYVQPLEDPEQVDERRAKVGLAPMSEYLKNWEMNWDAKAYLKDLPAIEEMEKNR